MSTAQVSLGVPTVSEPPRTVEAYRLPSLGYRIVVAAIRLVPLVLVLVAFPVAVLTYLASRSIVLPVSIPTVTVFGLAICAASTARYLARPTRAYGPTSMLTASLEIAYLLTLLLQSTYRFDVPQSSVTISVTYSRLLEILLAVPALWLGASIVTTVEDFRSPTERFPFDFPP